MENLMIIGSSHISKESVNEVIAAFENFDPDIVALELDNRRLYAIMNNIQSKPSISDIRKIGFNGYLFLTIGGWVQKKLGNMVGVTPGSEMKKAIDLALEKKKKIALIDQDITITLKKFSKAFTWKEKLRIIKDLFTAPFSKTERIDLSKVPEKTLIKKLMKEAKLRYPNLYRVLVEERNEIMSHNLVHIIRENPESRVLAVVGAGHKEEMEKIIAKMLQSHNQ